MLSHNDLKKGTQFLMDGEPYEVLESSHMVKGRGNSTMQVKMKNLKSGNVLSRGFKGGDTFEEAELEKREIKFVYGNRGKYMFSDANDPGNRFELTEEQLGDKIKFLVPNILVEGILFEGEYISIQIPIKLAFTVKEAPPGVQGDRSSGGTKEVILENGTVANVPLFVQTGDQIELNTENGEYVRRLDKAS
jgi:elongation factor P